MSHTDFEICDVLCPYCAGGGIISNHLARGNVMTCFICDGYCYITHAIYDKYMEYQSLEHYGLSEDDVEPKNKQAKQYTLFDPTDWK